MTVRTGDASFTLRDPVERGILLIVPLDIVNHGAEKGLLSTPVPQGLEAPHREFLVQRIDVWHTAGGAKPRFPLTVGPRERIQSFELRIEFIADPRSHQSYARALSTLGQFEFDIQDMYETVDREPHGPYSASVVGSYDSLKHLAIAHYDELGDEELVALVEGR